MIPQRQGWRLYGLNVNGPDGLATLHQPYPIVRGQQGPAVPAKPGVDTVASTCALASYLNLLTGEPVVRPHVPPEEDCSCGLRFLPQVAHVIAWWRESYSRVGLWPYPWHVIAHVQASGTIVGAASEDPRGTFRAEQLTVDGPLLVSPNLPRYVVVDLGLRYGVPVRAHAELR